MTSVVQTVAVNGLAGVSSSTVTIAATGAGNAIIITLSTDVGTSGNYSTFTITDNKSNIGYTAQKIQTANTRTAAVYALLSPATAGVTSVTIAGVGGVGGMFGCLSVQEVSGLTALDQTGAGNTGAASPLTLACSSVDTTATDFVTAAISVGGATSSTGISDPPSGYIHSAVEQDDIADSGGECCYRINSSAVTDSVTWAASVWANGCPAVIVSFKGATGATTLTAAAGSFTMTGEGAGLSQSGNTTLSAASGSFAMTGEAANLTSSGTSTFSLLANAGAFNFSGASSSSDIQTDANAGSFAFTGQAANLGAGIPLPPIVCAGGSFDSLTPMPGLML